MPNISNKEMTYSEALKQLREEYLYFKKQLDNLQKELKSIQSQIP